MNRRLFPWLFLAFLFSAASAFGQATYLWTKDTQLNFNGLAPLVNGSVPNVSAWTWQFTIKPANSVTAASSASDALISKTTNSSPSAASGGYTFVLTKTDGNALTPAAAPGTAYKLTLYASGTGYTGTIATGTLYFLNAVAGSSNPGSVSTSVDLTPITTQLNSIASVENDTNTKTTGLVGVPTTLSGLQTTLGTVNTGVGALSGVPSGLSSLSSTLGGVNTNVQALSNVPSSLTSLSNTVGGINSNVNSANTSLGTLATNLGTANTGIGNANTSLGTLTTNLGTANTGIGNANTTLGTVNTNVAALSNVPSNLTSLSNTVGSINGNVSTLQNGQTSQGTTLGTINTNVNSANTTLGTVTGTQSSHTSLLNAIQSALSSLATTCNSIYSTLQSFVTSTANSFSSQGSQLTSIQSAVSALSGGATPTPTPTPTPAPSAPAFQSVTAGVQSIAYTWTAVSGATGYKLSYGTTSGQYPNSADAGNVTSYNLTGLTGGTTYFAVLAAYNDAAHTNLSTATSPVSATAKVPVPGQVTGVSASASSSGNALAFSWSAVSGATGYKLAYGTATGVYGAPVSMGNVTSYTLSGLTGGTRYFAQITASNSTGNGTPSAEVNQTAAVAPPGIPQNFIATAGDVSVGYTWTAVSGATGYKLLYGPDANTLTNSVTLGAVTSYTLQNKPAGVPIVAALQSIIGTAFSANSNTASATPNAPTAETAFPAGIPLAVNGTIGTATVLKASDYNYGNITSAFAGNAVSVGTAGVHANFPQDAAGSSAYRTDAGTRNLKVNTDTTAPTAATAVPLVMGTEATNTYMRFSVGFPTTQSYNFTVRCANGGGDIAQFHLNLDGNALSSVVTVNPQGTWDTAGAWQSVDAGSFSVTAGTHVVTWYVDDQYLDFSAILITPVTNTGTTLASAVSMPAIGATTTNATLTAGSASPLVGSWYTVNGAAVQVTLSSGSNVTLFNGGAANNAGITSLSGAFTARSAPTTGLFSARGTTGNNALYTYGLGVPPFAAVIPSVNGGSSTAGTATADTRWTLTPGALSNGKMSQTIDAANQGAAQAAIANNKVIWVAVRTDGVDGAGTTPGDPRDGSTAAKITSIRNGTGNSENCTWHLAAGTYQWSGGSTNGGPSTIFKNQQYLGAGFDRTILASTGNFPFVGQDGYFPNGWQAFDLTLNCNPNRSGFGVGWAYLANNTTITRVHCINWGTTGTNGNEMFPFGMLGNSNYDFTWSGNVWDRCVFDQPIDSSLNNGTTAVDMGASNHQGFFNDTNKITHCYFGPNMWWAWERANVTGNTGYCHALFAPEVTESTMNDCETGHYIEPGRWGPTNNTDATWAISSENHNFHANTYINVKSPLHYTWSLEGQGSVPGAIEEGKLAGIETFADNVATISATYPYETNFGFHPMWSIEPHDDIAHTNQPILNTVIIRNNHYTGANTSRDGGVRINYTTAQVTSLTISNNVFDGPFGNPPIISINRSAPQTLTNGTGNTYNGAAFTIP